MPWAPAKPERRLRAIGRGPRRCSFSLHAVLHTLPQLIVDVARMRNFDTEIALRTVVTPYSGTANWIPRIHAPAPDQSPNMEFVPQQPILPARPVHEPLS